MEETLQQPVNSQDSSPPPLAVSSQRQQLPSEIKKEKFMVFYETSLRAIEEASEKNVREGAELAVLYHALTSDIDEKKIITEAQIEVIAEALNAVGKMKALQMSKAQTALVKLDTAHETLSSAEQKKPETLDVLLDIQIEKNNILETIKTKFYRFTEIDKIKASLIESYQKKCDSLKEGFRETNKTYRAERKRFIYPDTGLLTEWSTLSLEAKDKILAGEDEKIGKRIEDTKHIFNQFVTDSKNLDEIEFYLEQYLRENLKLLEEQATLTLQQKTDAVAPILDMDELLKQKRSALLINLTQWHDRLAVYCENGNQLQVKNWVRSFPESINECDNYGFLALHIACCSNQEEIVKDLLFYGAKPGEIDKAENLTAYHYACMQSNPAILELLFSSHSEASKANLKYNISKFISADPMTLLETASYYNQPGIVIWLIQNTNIHLNAQDIRGDTPLHWAARMGYKDVITCLIDHGANIHLINEKKETPMLTAAFHDKNEIVKIFMKYDYVVSNSKLSNADPMTLLQTALSYNKPEIVIWLIQNTKISINAQNILGDTPLHWAARMGYKDVITCLIDHGANIHLMNKKKESPILTAAIHVQNEIVKIFMEYDYGVSNSKLRNTDPMTLLQTAFSYDKPEIVIWLIQNTKISINAQNSLGDTLLHLAARVGHQNVITYLIKHEANIHIMNKKKERPIFTAAIHHKDKIITIFMMKYGYCLNNDEIQKLQELDKTSSCLNKSSENYKNIYQNILNPWGQQFVEPFYGKYKTEISIIEKILQDFFSHPKNSTADVAIQEKICETYNHFYDNLIEEFIKKYNDCIESKPFYWDSTIQILCKADTQKKNETLNSYRNKLKEEFDSQKKAFNLLMHNISSLPEIENHLADLVNKKLFNKEDEHSSPFSQIHLVNKRQTQKDGNELDITISNVNTKLNRQGWITNGVRGRLEDVKNWAKQGAQMINIIDKNGLLPLHVACLLGKLEVVLELLSHGAERSKKDDDHLTAYHYACMQPNPKILEALFSAKITLTTFNIKPPYAIPEIDSFSEYTLLHTAVSCHQVAIVTWLIKNTKINLNAKEIRKGETPLHLAAKLGDEDITACLISHGANVNITNKNLHRPVLTAALAHNHDALSIFMQYGCCLNEEEIKKLYHKDMSPRYESSPTRMAYANCLDMSLEIYKDLDPELLKRFPLKKQPSTHTRSYSAPMLTSFFSRNRNNSLEGKKAPLHSSHHRTASGSGDTSSSQSTASSESAASQSPASPEPAASQSTASPESAAEVEATLASTLLKIHIL